MLSNLNQSLQRPSGTHHPASHLTPNVNHWENPIPTDSLNQSTLIVQYGSTKSSDGDSPQDPPVEFQDNPAPLSTPTNNIGFSRGTYVMPNLWYRNYRLILTRENVSLLKKIDHITALIDKLLPGRGRLMGEVILF